MPNFRASYAQTVIQLFNQLRLAGYGTDDMKRIREGWEVARRLFTCKIQSSGKIFVSHCIGSASVMVAVKERAALVIAALLHNVYGNGRFPEGDSGAGESRRRRMRDLVGEEVEAMLFRFWSQPWNSDVLEVWLEQEELEPWQKDLLILRLADAIDHALVLGLQYEGAQQNRERFERDRKLMIMLAEKHGLHTLAHAWRAEVDRYSEHRISEEVAKAASNLNAVIMPASYMGRIRQKVHRLRNRIRVSSKR